MPDCLDLACPDSARLAKRVGRQGFTFIELIIAIFIFSLMMLAVAGIFSSSFGGYRNARIIQKDLEDAQFILNQMAKTLRTSSLIFPSGTAQGSQVKIYDYATQKCYNYIFEDTKIKVSSYAENIEGKEIADFCANAFPAANSLAAFFVQGQFFSTSSDKASGSEKMGKITISMEICSNSGCTADKAAVQTTVSLRDYYNAGI